ncbi:MAG: hypothetical protein R3F31_02810 [Verrucomicrobiales bacterium]
MSARPAWGMHADIDMIEYLKVARIDHWLKNVFIVFGHAVALVLVLQMEVTTALLVKAALSLAPRLPDRLGQLHSQRNPRRPF